VATAMAGAVLLAACGRDQGATNARAWRTARPLDQTIRHRLPGRRFVAGCEDPRVTGGLASDYRRESVVAGPLAIYPARSEFPRLPRDDFAPVSDSGPARYGALEAAVTVAPGARVTVSVPREDQRSLALLFDSTRWSDANRGYTVREGDRAVTFPGCRAPYTQYSGGFVVTRPQCAHLIVQAQGARPVRATVSFGARAC